MNRTRTCRESLVRGKKKVILVFVEFLFSFQQCLLSIAGSLIVPQLVAEAVCAENDDEFIRNMLSSTMLMSGMATFMQSCFGIRLPLYQGPSSGYIIPLIALRDLDDRRCSLEHHCKNKHYTVELQWLEHLRDHGNLFETWVVRAIAALWPPRTIAPGQEANGDNLGLSFPTSIKY